MPKARNEKTSTRIAKIAAKVLATHATDSMGGGLYITMWSGSGAGVRLVKFKWSDIQALAASALTQTADRPKRKAVKKS